MPYVRGTVYRLICLSHPEIQYVGSTFDELRYRFRNHKDGYKSYLNGKYDKISIFHYFTEYGLDNFKIVKIKDYIVYRENQKDHKHLNAYEQLWINKLKCVNKYHAFNPLKHIEHRLNQLKVNMTEEQIKKEKDNYANRTEEQIKKEQERQKKRNETIRNDPELLDKKRKQSRESAAKPWTCVICDITINQSGRCRHLKCKSHLDKVANSSKLVVI